MFIQHTAFLLDKGSQHRRRGILPPAVSIYLMNETRRKPTTGRQSPTLFDKWHGIFYMPSRIDEAGHTKAFDYPVAEHWGESQRAKRSLVGFEPTSAHTYESEIQRSTTYATPTPDALDRKAAADDRESITVLGTVGKLLETSDSCTFASAKDKLSSLVGKETAA